jgi:hypothetical protein
MVRVEGLQEKPVSFDGDWTHGVSSRLEESLLETFVMDTPEGMVYAARSGGSVRLLGRGFGPDPRRTPNYQGPRYDIFEVIAPLRFASDRPLRVKRYYFDSVTGLPESTRYMDSTGSPAVTVETRFSGWRQLDGSSYPGRIERYENGRAVFSFIVTGASGRARQAAANFR